MVEAREQRRQGDGHQAESGGDAQTQGRGRDRDRSDEQEGEGVLEPSGEIEQGRELKHVEAEHHEGIARFEPLARRVADAQDDIDPGGERDHREAPADWEIDADHPIGADHRHALAEHREPAQSYDGLEPEPALAVPQAVGQLRRARGLTLVRCSHR
jgi:hypothetical protein